MLGGAAHDEQLIADAQATAGQRARHHRAGAGCCEGPVDPQARSVTVDRGRRVRQHAIERESQLPEPDPGRCVDGDDLGDIEERPRDVVGDLEAGQLDVLVIDETDLGERDHTVRHAEQFEDAQVFLGLGLPAFGGGNDEQARVDGADAGEHVLEKADVAGHVDERDPVAGRQLRPCEAEVDGEPASLLLREPIGVDAGQGEDEGRLAVVDVARGGDDVHERQRVSSRRD